ncbi:Crp/Fnr family transcriptional regulator [Echinicola shivajiensis]|uniref:Crp/Fnr family transcriptional regulator n=1 Tax=Echinicola shivajiensis TaxID=1035916 RepID=UPI001BFC8EE8|nr:Crp/Fnr family transcriptional regulator [Echinicola shivajiensis]
MSNQELIEHFKQVFPLQEADLKVFLSKFKSLCLKKGEYFIHEGQICKKIGFILEGSMLCSYNKDGQEIIDEFSLDKEFITDYYSFLTHLPADKNVKCLEDSELLVIAYDDIQSLYSQNPIYEKLGRIMAEKLFINWQQKNKSLMLDNAETRYSKLINRRPDLPQRIPQYLIASYLNIKPETLSRIRKKLASS